ncbi:MAG: antibiotic transport system ATP-binding protein, partial [bacterium]
HILPEVQATCSRVMIIAGGKLVADDTPEGLARKASGGQEIRAVIKGDGAGIERGLREAASRLGPARYEGSAPGGMIYRFSVPAGTESHATAEAIFRLVTDNGWALTELSHDAASLESIFRTLTGNPGAVQ